MNTSEQRVMIYSALALLCCVLGALAGPAAGIWSFVQIAAVVELLFWLGVPASNRIDQFKSVK